MEQKHMPKFNANSAGIESTPFWKRKSLEDMSEGEWESLCDGCGRCCLNKLEDWDTGEIVWTRVACSLLDENSCRCKDYDNRFSTIPDCVQLTPEQVRRMTWLPPTCAYQLLAEGRDLYWWHPLVSGDAQSVHEAGVSVRGGTVSEEDVGVEEYENYIIVWPEETQTRGEEA